MSETCKTCKWFSLVGISGLPGWESAGMCLFRPPTGQIIYTIERGDEKITLRFIRPIAFEDETCGEHQPKEQANAD